MTNKLFRALIQNKVSNNVTKINPNYLATSLVDDAPTKKAGKGDSPLNTTRSNLRKPVSGTSLADVGREKLGQTQKGSLSDDKNIIRNIINKDARIVTQDSRGETVNHRTHSEGQTLSQIAKQKLNK